MTYEQICEALDLEWSPGDGFFWQIREGRFPIQSFVRAFDRVSSISISEDALIPRRVVSLLWYIPLFMDWQTERIREAGGDVDEFVRATSRMTAEIERLLGVTWR